MKWSYAMHNLKHVLVAAILILLFCVPQGVFADTVYIVQRGDNLSRIAARFGVTTTSIVQANNLRNPNQIYTGQRLIIPTGPTAPIPTPQAPGVPATGETYIVQRGDTLGGIAARFGVSVNALMTANRITNPNRINVGQRLLIPRAGSAPAPTPPPPAPTALPGATPPPAAPTTHQGPNGRVTVAVPTGGRYIAIGDSLSYGSTLAGSTNYEGICINRRPYVEQIQADTGIASTASLDRGDSMKTPFFENFCSPPAGTPTLSTTVPGSNSAEWIETLGYYPAVSDSLADARNTVVLLLIGGDVFAEKIGKPSTTVDQYERNIGRLIQHFIANKKVVYLATIPHVRTGSFIPSGELAATNARIDELNYRLRQMVVTNSYLDTATGNRVSFGEQLLVQDGLRLWVNSVQSGPDLAQVSDARLQGEYASDGLHFSVRGYNIIGSAWTEALRAPIRVNRKE